MSKARRCWHKSIHDSSLYSYLWHAIDTPDVFCKDKTSTLPPAGTSLHTIRLAEDIYEFGANFYFTNYCFKESPFSHTFHKWKIQAYHNATTDHVLRAAIEAVGMAGMANVSQDSTIATKSSRRYNQGVIAIERAFEHEIDAIADETLMALVVMGLYAVNLALSTPYQCAVL